MSAAVTGLDLSLAGSGVVTVRQPVDGERYVAKRLVESDAFPRGYQPTLAEWVARQTRIAHEVLTNVPSDRGLVVVEAPSFGSRFGNPHERAGLWWRVVQYLVRRGDVVVSVSPKTRAKYAAGSGSADKRAVLAGVQESMPWAQVKDHNLADGLALAAMGWRFLGRPIDGAASRPMTEAMRAVRWPESMKGMTA